MYGLLMITVTDIMNTVLIEYYIRLWDIDSGACLRILEGHEELVR